MIPRKVGFKVDFMYPRIIHKSLRDLPILSLGALNFFLEQCTLVLYLEAMGHAKSGS
jgi:hypothetical protein